MQQVNLYQPIFRKQEKVFSARTMLQGGAVVLVGLILFTLFVQRQGAGMREQLQQAEQLRDQRTQQLVEASGLFPEKVKSADLEEQVAYFRRRVEMRQRLLVALQSRESGGADGGFSDHLAALSRQRTPQLWLSRVALRGGGADIRLDGFSYDPEQVPQFIQGLATEPAFQGQGFRHFTIQRDADESRRVGFSLHSLPPELAPATAGGGGDGRYVSLKRKAAEANR